MVKVSRLAYVTSTGDRTSASATLHFEATLADGGFPTVKTEWVLTLGDHSFPLRDCAGHATNSLTCTTTALSWIDEGFVDVKLTRWRKFTGTVSDDNVLWSGTLTPGSFIISTTNYVGFDEDESHTSLSDDTFEAPSGEEFRINRLGTREGSGVTPGLYFGIFHRNRCAINLQEEMSSAVLVVEGVALPFSEIHIFATCHGAYQWNYLPFSLTAGQAVELKIVSTTPREEPSGPLSAPRNLHARSSATAISLSWVSPEQVGDSAVTGHKIQVTDDKYAGTINWSDLEANTMSTRRSYLHDGLEEGDVRWYRVAAINDEGTGPWSNVAEGTAKDSDLLSVPDPEPVAESATSEMTFTVSVTKRPAWPVGVHYETVDGRATESAAPGRGGSACPANAADNDGSVDYVTTRGKLYFVGKDDDPMEPETLSGQDAVRVDDRSYQITVKICNDNVEDSGETFRLVLKSTQLHVSIEVLREIEIGPEGLSLEGEETASATGTITNHESTTELSIAADAAYVEEGTEAAFTVRRAGDAEEALTVPVTVTETGATLGTPVPAGVTLAAGVREASFRVPTEDDGVVEAESTVTVTLEAGFTWQLAEDSSSASLAVLDNDATPATSTSTLDVTVWSADMTVVDYENGSIGAGSADLLANQGGTAGLLAKWLYYVTGERKLKIAFNDGLDDAESMTLHVGDLSVAFPENSGGDSSFNIPNVDVSWTDGETLAARITKPSASAVSTDATLASLAVSGADLSPAFDAGVLVYRANVGADTEAVTLSATTADDGATVSYGPAEDTDAQTASHQVATPAGETLAEVTVTAADGQTVRTYRVVVVRPVPVVVSFGSSAYTATEGGEAASVTVELDTDAKREVTIALTASPEGGAAADDYTVADSVTFTGGGALSRTVVVTAVADDTAEENERVVLGFGSLPDGVEAGAAASATVTLADAEVVNAPPEGLPSISGTAEVGQTLTASVSGISDADGMDDASFAYQWIGNDGADADIGGATGSSHTLQPSDAGKTIKVRVTFEDDGGTEETLVSEPTGAVNTPPTGAPTIGGTPEVGETLTADVSAIADADGMDDASFAYQWIGNDGADADIGGATGSSYTLEPSDADKTIKVRVTFEDDGGTQETLVSAATGVVAGASSLSVADAEATEEDDATLDFAVTLSPAAASTVTVDYATADGTATAGADYTATSGTLTFEAGDTSKTVSVSITDDAVDDGGETLTLTLGNASGADIGGASATGIIRDDDGNRLTARFEEVPAEHDGTTFVFDVRFSEDPAVSYRVLRDESFDVTGGAVVKARRKDGRDDLREIHVEPSGNGDVTVSLPATTDCDAHGAICTADGRPLSNANSATVPGQAASAVANGPVLTLAWPTPRDGFAAPHGADFAVRVDGSLRALSSASLWTHGAVLLMAEPVLAGEEVVVDYLGSAMHALRDAAGGTEPAWRDLAAVNVTGLAEAGADALATEGAARAMPADALSLSLAGRELDAAGLAALAARTDLRRLDLSGIGLTDLSALAPLRALRSLDLSGNAVSDLSPLAGMTELRRLDLAGNRVVELWPLGALPHLEVLLLDGNDVADVGALTHLYRLENLGLSGNRIGDVSPLADLGSLRRLDLGGNPVRDLSAVGDLGTLVWLRLPSADEGAPTHRLVRLRWLLAPNAAGACLGCGDAAPGHAEAR